MNLIVRKGLEFVDESVVKLREVVKYIDGYDSRLCQFEQAVVDTECVFNGKLSLDVVTRWNATYTMLQKSLQTKPALKSYINRVLGIDYKLSDDEWILFKMCATFCIHFIILPLYFLVLNIPHQTCILRMFFSLSILSLKRINNLSLPKWRQ